MSRDDGPIEHALEVLQNVDRRELERRGFHLDRADFYSSANQLDFLDANRDLWAIDGPCAEVDWNHEVQIATAQTVARFVPELRHVPSERDPAEGVGFQWSNEFWAAADALVQYGIVRDRAPRRYVEIGCGWSSLLLAQAIEANATPTSVTLVEPYPNQAIFEALPREWRRYPTILQRAPFEIFDELRDGDVCFYDGSHCARVGSDVNWFFFRVLPRLASGVLIHLHDVFLPEPYPDDWIFNRHQSWNEQFLLQAFLMHNTAYEIVIANRYLWRREQALLDGLYAGVQPSYGCSIWLRKR